MNTSLENFNEENIVEDKKVKRDFIMHRRASVRVCKDCGKFYILSDNDVIHYITKYNSMPLRCEVCRKKIREAHPYPIPISDVGEN